MPGALRAAMVGVLLTALASPALAAGLTEASVRGFVAAQEKAWNSRAFVRYFNNFSADAVFVDQTRTPEEVITYGRSTVTQARALTTKSRTRSAERGAIRGIAISPDGRSARVTGSELIVVTTPTGARRVCAEREQTLVLRNGRVLSRGQTDTIVKCR